MPTQEDEGPLTRMCWSLEGLSVGDAFGENLFNQGYIRNARYSFEEMVTSRIFPGSRWVYTDDTHMALSVVSTLFHHGKIDQLELAESFGRRFDPSRGYGPAMYRLLPQIKAGLPAKQGLGQPLKRQGSSDNGGAMRVAPVGAFFADDLAAVVEHAGRSAEVTHTHPETRAGATAVALAAAWAWRLRQTLLPAKGAAFLQLILPLVPDSQVRQRIEQACTFPPDTPICEVVMVLGNGSGSSAQDTVPYALWCAAQHLDNYEDALWLTASGRGDIDTNCAIVGGIVACYTGIEGIPPEWLKRREPLPDWPFEPSPN